MLQAKILIVDNYDSFTYNLVNILRKGKKHNFVVKRNDAFDLDFVAGFDKILFSPLPSHLSSLTSHLSPLTSHLSPLTSPFSSLPSHLSPLNSFPNLHTFGIQKISEIK